MHGMPIQFHGIDASPRTMITGEVFLQLEETTICLPFFFSTICFNPLGSSQVNVKCTYSINLISDRASWMPLHPFSDHKILRFHFPAMKKSNFKHHPRNIPDPHPHPHTQPVAPHGPFQFATHWGAIWPQFAKPWPMKWSMIYCLHGYVKIPKGYQMWTI